MDINIHNVNDGLFEVRVLDNGVHVLVITTEVIERGEVYSYPKINLFFDTKAEYENFKRSAKRELVEA